MGTAAAAAGDIGMDAAAAFPWTAGDVAPRRTGERRTIPGLGWMASILLHGAVLAGVAEWKGDRADAPSAMEVSVLLERMPDAPAAVTQPSVPPSSSAKPQVDPSRRRSEPPPYPAISAKTAPAPVLQSAPGMEPSTVPIDSSGGGSPGTKGDTSDGGISLAGTGMASDAQAMPSPNNPVPTYPVSARRAGREGRTVHAVIVAPNGDCMDIEVVESSGTPSLDEAAATAVRRWRFTPALRAGRAVEATIRVPVVFRLTEAS